MRSITRYIIKLLTSTPYNGRVSAAREPVSRKWPRFLPRSTCVCPRNYQPEQRFIFPRTTKNARVNRARRSLSLFERKIASEEGIIWNLCKALDWLDFQIGIKILYVQGIIYRGIFFMFTFIFFREKNCERRRYNLKSLQRIGLTWFLNFSV